MLILTTALFALVGCSTPNSNLHAKTRDIVGPGMACGKRSQFLAGTSIRETLLSGSAFRSYIIHIPRHYRSDIAQPLVLNFHGHSSNALTQERLTGMSLLSDRDNFIAVYPQGTVGADGLTGL
ncbi:MAG: hypothetical protein J2P36_39465, partial [Ktedonobacteraceae bacterium]|nr:hypothetical protein [Ktedonobacteraceae bacterium]